MKISIPFLALFIAVFFALSTPSEGVVLSDTCSGITDQVKLGECLFNEETFNGNGRTCASCHPPENNFTIDPKWIATLPSDHPLFAFKTVPELSGMCRPAGGTPPPGGDTCTTNSDCPGAGDTCDSLENEMLMRKYGLILENVDGLDKPGRMRSVPHTLSLNTSLVPRFGPTFPGQKRQHTGWSGDGSPGGVLTSTSGDGPFTGFCSVDPTLLCQGFSATSQADADGVCATAGAGVCNGFGADGSLKSFAIGAVIQHAPRTLARELGVDFRLPTEEELIAMEAYQLAQGRQADDPGITTRSYNNEFVNEGKEQFFNGDNRCSTCHGLVGAGVGGTGVNLNFNTGAEAMTNPHKLEMVGAPEDGGFGGGLNGFCTTADPLAGSEPISCSGATQPLADASCTVAALPLSAGPCNITDDSFGDGTFNTPPLIEAADTAPFMHNNAVRTLEEAVAFYQTPNFSRGDQAQRLEMTADTVGSIAAFLRTVNALFNLDQAEKELLKGEEGCTSHSAALAMADTEDAYQVLEGSEVKLFGEAVNILKQAHEDGNKLGNICSAKPSKKVQDLIAKFNQVRALILAP